MSAEGAEMKNASRIPPPNHQTSGLYADPLLEILSELTPRHHDFSRSFFRLSLRLPCGRFVPHSVAIGDFHSLPPMLLPGRLPSERERPITYERIILLRSTFGHSILGQPRHSRSASYVSLACLLFPPGFASVSLLP